MKVRFPRSDFSGESVSFFPQPLLFFSHSVAVGRLSCFPFGVFRRTDGWYDSLAALVDSLLDCCATYVCLGTFPPVGMSFWFVAFASRTALFLVFLSLLRLDAFPAFFLTGGSVV